MAITAQGRLTAHGVLLSWTDTNEDSYTISVTEYDFTDPDNPSTRSELIASPDVLTWLDEDVDSSTDHVTYVITNDNDAQTATVSLTLFGESYGEVDATASTVRYTTLAAVKLRLGIPTVDDNKDAELTQCIITAEGLVDEYCGRSFADTGALPAVASIPERVKRAAAVWSCSLYTRDYGGGDPFDREQRALAMEDQAMQLLLGLRVSWGVA